MASPAEQDKSEARELSQESQEVLVAEQPAHRLMQAVALAEAVSVMQISGLAALVDPGQVRPQRVLGTGMQAETATQNSSISTRH